MISGSVQVVSDKRLGKSKSFMQSLVDSSSGSDSQQFKQFLNGNHIWIESTGLDADRLRSKTCDAIFFDEVQDIPAAALGNAVKILSKAKYGRVGDGIQVYFGTPKQKGSTYWDMWNASSQQYYYLGCASCKKHFPLYTPGSNDWEKIWLYQFIVKCTHCGHEQDKRDAAERGKWVAAKDTNDAKLIGFHINQLYMPEFTKEKILSEKPENHPVNTERAYQNEVLGEFFQGEAGIMSPDQLREICGDFSRKFRANISQSENKLVFLGLDIGKKADLEQLVDKKTTGGTGQSYSTAVVISVEGLNKISIEFATKFKRNDLASKKGLVEQIMKNYNVNLAVCDIGYANDFNEIMQTEFGHKFLSSQATGRVNDHVKFIDAVFPKLINFERDFYISEMYEQLKKGNVRFPLGDYEQINWLIQHCTSMEIKPSISTKTGEVSANYVKGSSPNDGMMALINAYLAYKFYVSDGFKVKNPLLYNKADPKKKDQIMAVTGYMPKLR